MRCGYGVGILNLKPVVLKSNIIGVVNTMPNETIIGSSDIGLEKLILLFIAKLIEEILSVMKSNLMREILISPDRVGKLKVYPKETIILLIVN